MTQIIAIGNPAIDHILNVSEQVLKDHNLVKGSGDYSRTAVEIMTLIAEHGPGDMIPGGAVANSMHSAAQLGLDVTYIGHYGKDISGQVFAKSMADVGVRLTPPQADGESFNLGVLVTEDAERTFIGQPMPMPLIKETVENNFPSQAEWLVVEGYPLFDASAQEAIQYAIMRAKGQGTKVALCISSLALVELAWSPLTEMILQGVDLIVGNKEEIAELERKAQASETGVGAPLHARILKTPRVVTNSGKGASYFDGAGSEIFAECNEVQIPVDTTGAGDAFIAGFFYGLLTYQDVERALKCGHVLGHKIILQQGARLTGLTPEMFD